MFGESCKLGKLKSVSHKYNKNIRSNHPLVLLYTDLWGPCRVEGRYGKRYFLFITDDFSHRVSVYPLKLKSDTFDVVKRHIIRAETYLKRKVKSFRMDNSREIDNISFNNFFDDKGIHHEFTNVYTLQQNGVAERLMSTAADGMRTLLIDSNLDPRLLARGPQIFYLLME